MSTQRLTKWTRTEAGSYVAGDLTIRPIYRGCSTVQLWKVDHKDGRSFGYYNTLRQAKDYFDAFESVQSTK